MKRTYNTLAALMADDSIKSRWVGWGGLEFYLRKGHIAQQHRGSSYIRPCLMVANFSAPTRFRTISESSAWAIIKFMREVEQNAVRFGYSGVLVESVLNSKLWPLLARCGYRKIGSSSKSFFKPTARIVATMRERASIQQLQRPSLRKFLETPGIEKFWLREQRENVVMLVRRDRVGFHPIEAGMRLTILQLYRYKVSSKTTIFDHSIYWSDHEALLVRLLKKLESRLAAKGFQEIAVSSLAISPSVLSDHGGRTILASDLNTTRHRMEQIGYVACPNSTPRRVYTKVIKHGRASR